MKTLAERFWAKVEKTEGCWIWIGAKLRLGYGHIYTGGGAAAPKWASAHRVAYELEVGPIPEGFQLDHLCRNPSCVRPSHLEPVTPRENLRRGEAPNWRRHRAGVCVRGHERSRENTVFRHDGRVVYCKVCRRQDRREAKIAEMAVA